ncbi:MAG: TAT-variant-translocated molybdopterin oxidoreductase, partial [Planctomycetes bacterium]|nr:TAT-variant-translocated molybdopterin oxidoreductase [Planctomycetota bacterium]
MSSLERSTSKRYWRSLAELQDAPEFRAFAEAEFPHEADPAGISRRRWLQIMGASLALAGAAGCETDPQFILPFAKRPEGRVPGKREHYATAMELSGNAVGLLVTCVDGRPIKVEGNPAHPFSLGATNVLAQAAILELYDPDRSRRPVQKGPHGGITQRGGTDQTPWNRFDAMLRGVMEAARSQQGDGFCVLAEPCSSPTLARLRQEFLKQFPHARWFEYEPLTTDNERAGAVQAFGRPYRCHFELSEARVIVCFEADLLGSHPGALRYARQFAQVRPAADGTMNRLYAVECAYSVTGIAADHRLSLPRRRIGAFVAKVLERIERLERGEDSASEPAGESAEFADRFLDAVVEDLSKNRGRGVVAVGPEQPPEVHAAAHRLNSLLGNVGKTVRYAEPPDPDRLLHVEAITELTHLMRDGKVTTLLILGGNPVYDAPADLDFAAALEKVATSIHCSLYRNETSLLCDWHVPQAHFLESWSDAR